MQSYVCALAILLVFSSQSGAAFRLQVRSPKQTFNIFANKSPEGISVNASTQLSEIQIEIARILSIPIPRQRIYLRGKLLEETSRTVRQLGIQKDDTLRVKPVGLPGGVYYGAKSNWTDYDFVVRLVHDREDGARETCSGLVQGYYVLSAAHCFSVAKGGQPDVRKWKLITQSGEKPIKRGMIHEKYDPEEGSYDVAFLELYEPHHGSEVLLDAREVGPDETLQMAGFGMSESGRTGVFAVAQFTSRKCGPDFASLGAVAPQATICAGTGPQSPTSTCGGDSGGPWWRMSMHEGKTIIVGVQAFGYDGGCGTVNKKSGITRISHAQDFIKRHTPFKWLELPEKDRLAFLPATSSTQASDASQDAAGRLVRVQPHPTTGAGEQARPSESAPVSNPGGLAPRLAAAQPQQIVSGTGIDLSTLYGNYSHLPAHLRPRIVHPSKVIDAHGNVLINVWSAGGL